MSPRNECLQPRFYHMGVNLRCRNIGMAQHFLYAAQICPICQEVAGERVAQNMRATLRGSMPDVMASAFSI